MNNEKVTNIVVMGSGYVGTVTAVMLALKNHQANVWAYDTNNEKVARIASGDPCIDEKGLEVRLKKVLKSQKLQATVNPECIKDADYVITCVGTPTSDDCEVNISYVLSTAEMFARNHKPGATFIVKSTVPPTAFRKIYSRIESISKNPFTLVSNPEFLREGCAVSDFEHPDRVVFGIDARHKNDRILWDKLKYLYGSIITPATPVIFTSLESAALGKYASNTFLATKIAFINAVAEVAASTGADIQEVAQIMGTDPRIGERFLEAGMGYGGSCFPKDLRGIWGLEPTVTNSLFKAVNEQNSRSAIWAVGVLNNRVHNWQKMPISIFGLTFKPHTDDCRESQVIKLVQKILYHSNFGSDLIAWDHEAGIESFKKMVRGTAKKMFFDSDPLNVLAQCKIAILTTAWPEIWDNYNAFQEFLDNGGLIIDCRNIFAGEFDGYPNYYRVGRAPTCRTND